MTSGERLRSLAGQRTVLHKMTEELSLETLHRDIATAVMLAAEGDLEGGIEVLRAGVHRASGADGHDSSEPLASAYRSALAGYVRRYGERAPAPDDSAGEP